jgi:holo-[acyl-carrier protein] synthase
VVLGVGVDVVEVARVRRAVQRWGQAFLARVFTPGELQHATARDGPVRLAARFAAKEAVMKALGCGWGRVRFRDIEILRDPSGRPHARLHGEAARVAERLGVAAVHVSLSHAREYAVAVAVAEGPREAGDR